MERRPAILLALTIVAALVVGACTRPDLVDDSAGRDEPTELRWRPAGDAVVCDGTERRAGTVEQAEAGELIEFRTALPVDVPPGRADDDGRYALSWRCDPEEAQLRWELTATGADSGRTVRLTVVGAPRPAEERPVVATLAVDTVVCDGTEQAVGVLAGLDPGERVSFESDRDGPAAEPKADRDGNLAFGWRCRPGDVGRTWRVTAAAVGSGRTTSFELTGLPPADDRPLAVESAVTEIVCDNEIHFLATIVNLFPFESVGFTASPPADDLVDGTADGTGRLDLRWQCRRDAVGRTWDLTATATETGKTVDLRFTGVAGRPPEPATVRPLEDPIVCDGRRRPVAEVGGLDPGEYVDFSSPESGPLLEGRANRGTVTVHWVCDPGELEGADSRVWTVTATGRESGRSVTFEITGVESPPPLGP